MQVTRISTDERQKETTPHGTDAFPAALSRICLLYTSRRFGRRRAHGGVHEVAAIIGYYAAALLLAKTLRVFRGSWKGVLAAAAACAAVCGVLHADVLGLAEKVPAVSAVESVQLYAADNNYAFYPGEEDALLEQVRALHKTIAADRAYIRAVPAAAADDDEAAYTYVRLTYHLKDGRKVEREYSLPLSRARMAQDVYKRQFYTTLFQTYFRIPSLAIRAR